MFGLPLGTTLKILFTGLKVINAIVKYLDNQKMLDAGASREVARQLAEIAVRARVSDQVRDQISSMSDSDLDAELRGDKK